ncbi:hypothetical protein P389DRAFT_197597 [Cystobasidium minutum MCA 4210]|uniref:uncharacterized protein n=1 Tax=Cystobasidium minutum MCA 4210 TaxID=1397322 RepID=UPI0034CE069C|eukprot:jgi/Rhomi1/197597/gm1.5811_g
MSSRYFDYTHKRMGPRCPIEQLPQEVLERICQHLPASSKITSCLSLVRTAKLWYAPAIRELFASVTIQNEDHAQGVLSTLSADKRTDGALALTVRKVCLIVGEEADRKPPPPPRIPHANLAVPPALVPPNHPLNATAAMNTNINNGAAQAHFAGLGNNHAHHFQLANAATLATGGHGGHAPHGGAVGGQGPVHPHYQFHLSNTGQLVQVNLLNNPHNQQVNTATAAQAPMPAVPGPNPSGTTPFLDLDEDSDSDTDEDDATPPLPPVPPAPAIILPQLLHAQAATGAGSTTDDWALEVPAAALGQHLGQLTAHQVQQLQPPNSQRPQIVHDEDDDEAREEQERHPPLTLSSALDILAQTNSIQALTVRLPTKDLLDDRTMSTLGSLRHLRKLDIAGKLTFKQLWQLLKSLPCLEDLTVSGLSSGPDADASELLEKEFEDTSLNLHSVTMYYSELEGELLHSLLQACGSKVTSLKLSRFVTSSRAMFKRILQMIGPSLRQLALQRLVFRGAAPAAADQHLLHILDDLPTYSPMLEELQVAAERIVSPRNFFRTVLPSLFLAQLELDYYHPIINEDHVMDLLANLPKGRMETLSFGSKLKHLQTPKIQRACQDIGIVVLGAGDM